MKVNRLRDVDPWSLKRISVDMEWGVSWLYFLFSDNELVYVGQSVRHPATRIYDHWKQKRKKFDSYSYMRIRTDLSLDFVEQYFIKKFNPRYNKAHRSDDKEVVYEKEPEAFIPEERGIDNKISGKEDMAAYDDARIQAYREHWINSGKLKL